MKLHPERPNSNCSERNEAAAQAACMPDFSRMTAFVCS